MNTHNDFLDNAVNDEYETDGMGNLTTDVCSDMQNDKKKCVYLCETAHVETVVKLSLKKDTPKIEVTMEPDKESNYIPKEKATYQKIKNYVLEKYGLKVSSLYIAQIKDKCGLDKERIGNKWKKNENAIVPQCTPQKEEAILDAFKYLKLI